MPEADAGCGDSVPGLGLPPVIQYRNFEDVFGPGFCLVIAVFTSDENGLESMKVSN